MLDVMSHCCDYNRQVITVLTSSLCYLKQAAGQACKAQSQAAM